VKSFSCDQTSGRAPCLTAFCVFVGKASSRPLDPIYSDRKNEFSFHVLIHIASSSSMAPFFSDVDLLLSFALRMRPVLLNVCFDKCDRRLVESRQKPSHPWKRLFKHYMWISCFIYYPARCYFLAPSIGRGKSRKSCSEHRLNNFCVSDDKIARSGQWDERLSYKKLGRQIFIGKR
jgi:hypothetical protein